MERYELNKNLAQMLKGGVIMDVVNAKEAEIAQKAGPLQLWHWREFHQILENRVE